MCNEYRFKQSLDHLADSFSQLNIPLHWAAGAPNLEPRDSIRPTDPAPILVGSPDGAELKQLRWGFANPHNGGPIINFRSDGRRFATGRCLIPADGFYEFTGARAPKSKWLFTAADDSLFCIAGLAREDRFTMLTMEPGPDIAPYHNRQVVILPREQWAAWLGASPDAKIPALPAGSLNVVQIR
ncbi:SOS response-associated peptidase [Phenylobacterium sp.]|uniref:SOS response-associated peptidase n=1 Tax=Phenylobacterium sp. TaxID=1871053 RepID=UPI0012029F3B|nr:SOS response-associated peptidase [Phenylobacterium sp.]THD57516.1 MAG: SOS response-associated peptidase [Phenylobacterium sp.]